MHDEFPDWLLRSDAPPPEVREKLAALLPAGPDAYHTIDTLCLIAHDFACANVEQRRYQSVYNRQKRRRKPKQETENHKTKVKESPPYKQHAGEELERIRDAAMELHNAIVSIRPHARRLLDKELSATTTAIDQTAPRPGREAILYQLHRLVDAIDGSTEHGRKGALAQAGKGRKTEGIASLVDGIGQEHRYALGRVPSHSELEKLLTAIFGNQCGFGYVKEWCKWANRRDRWEWAASAYAIPATPHHPLNSLIFRCTKIVTFKQPPFAK